MKKHMYWSVLPAWTGLALVLSFALTAPALAKGPQIQTWQMDNGARVLFVEAHELPMADVRVVFDAGSARDGDKPGLARLTNLMLNQGAGDWDAEAIAERFDGVGARYGASSLRDMAVLSLRSLVEPALLDTALDTFAEVLRRPRFPADAFDRERSRTQVALRNEAQSPGALAEKAFYRALYGEHPYASPMLGTPESVAALTPGDLAAFHRRYYVAANAIIAIVGDLTRPQAEAVARRVAGRLPAGAPAPSLPPIQAAGSERTVPVQHPSTQSHLLVGQPGMSRDDPEYFALYVGNHVLGGSGFGSRIMHEVREARGLAYSAYSYFAPMRVPGPFIMGLQTRTEQVGQAHRVLMQTLREFVEKGPTAEELEKAKSNITGGFPLRIDSNSDIVEYLSVIGFYGLPLDYLDTFTAKVEAVTAEQIRAAFQRRMHPDKQLTVVVGSTDQQASR